MRDSSKVAEEVLDIALLASNVPRRFEVIEEEQMWLRGGVESFEDIHLAIVSFAFREPHTPRNQLDEQLQRCRFHSGNPVDTIFVLGLDTVISYDR